MTMIVAGLIGAGIMAASGLLGSLTNDARAREQAAAQKKYIEEMYKINKARAEEEFAAAKEQANRNAAQVELQADLTDKSLNVSEQGLSNDFNATIDNMYLSQEADAYNWNNAAMQQGKSEGAAYTQLAASGVRSGSSLSDAVEMESAVNENQLQFAQDSKRRSDNNNLASVLSNLTSNRYNIQQARIGADIQREDAAYLRNSYLEGGHNYNLYQNQLEALKTTTDYNATQADYQYEQHSGWNSVWNGVIATTGGAAQGFQTGTNLYQNWNYAKTYKG